MMTGRKPTPKAPELRFPEFRSAGNWHFKPLSEIADPISDRVGGGNCVPMSVSTGVGLVSQDEKFGRIIAGDSIKNYIRLQENDFAYNKSSTKEFPQGYIARYCGTKDAAVPNSIFTCFRPNAASAVPHYLEYLFHGNHHGRWLRKFITVGARAHGALSVSDDDLMSMPVPLPPIEVSLLEQQKIADCLGSLDDLIAAEGRKLEALREHKQGLMQQLFPQEGETKSRLGSHSDWSTHELSAVAFFQEGPGIMATDFHSEGVPLVRLSGLSGESVTLEGCNYLNPDKVEKKWRHFRLVPGDLLISTSASFGLVSIVTRIAAGAVFYTGIVRFRSIDEQLKDSYLRAYLESPHFLRQAGIHAVGGGIKHFGPTHLRQMQIQIPEISEQRRISGILSTVDACIGGQARKLEALNQHKQGLLQQLFPPLSGQ